MRHVFSSAVLFAGIMLLPALATAAPSRADAQKAYNARDHSRCALIYTQLTQMPDAIRSDGYNAACCLALAGDADAAFEQLRDTILSHYTRVADIEQDPDFAPLHGDPRWQPLLDLARQEEDRHLAGTDRALRHELFVRMNHDQQMRGRLMADPENRTLLEEMQAIDRDNTGWLKNLIDTRGWPGYKLVYKDGAQAAWLLAQHADLDPDFQQQVLELLEKAVLEKDASPSHLAYLVDRVRTGRDQKQLYGTQFIKEDGHWLPAPIEDEANVDARRQRIGLGTLAEYAEQIRDAYAQ